MGQAKPGFSLPDRARLNMGWTGLSFSRTAMGQACVRMGWANVNKKLRYREEHSASVVLSWCNL